MYARSRRYGIKTDQLMTPLEMMAENRILSLLEPMESRFLGMMTDLRFLACENNNPIKIEIISYGGPLAAALALYHTISSLNKSGIPVYTIGQVCYSAAALLLAAGMRGHRYLYPEGTVMLHASSVGVIMGNIAQADINILKKNDRILINLICELCGRPEKDREKLYKEMVDDGKEFWFNAEEAKEFGIIDQIVTPEIDRQLFGNLKLPSWEEAKPPDKRKRSPKNVKE